MLHEEVNEKTFGVVAQVGKLTADEIKKAIEKILAELQAQAKSTGTPDIKHGKQSLKELSAQNAGLSSIELPGNCGTIKSCAAHSRVSSGKDPART